MNTNMLRLMIILALSGAAVLSGCTPKKPVSSEGVAIEKTLQQAETDARAGNEKKALEEIDSAEKALIEEDKNSNADHPVSHVLGGPRIIRRLTNI